METKNPPPSLPRLLHASWILAISLRMDAPQLKFLCAWSRNAGPFSLLQEPTGRPRFCFVGSLVFLFWWVYRCAAGSSSTVDQIVDATENFASSKETNLISSYGRERERESRFNIFLFNLGLRNLATLTPFFYVSRTAQLILKVLEK